MLPAAMFDILGAAEHHDTWRVLFPLEWKLMEAARKKKSLRFASSRYHPSATGFAYLCGVSASYAGRNETISTLDAVVVWKRKSNHHRYEM